MANCFCRAAGALDNPFLIFLLSEKDFCLLVALERQVDLASFGKRRPGRAFSAHFPMILLVYWIKLSTVGRSGGSAPLNQAVCPPSPRADGGLYAACVVRLDIGTQALRQKHSSCQNETRSRPRARVSRKGNLPKRREKGGRFFESLEK